MKKKVITARNNLIVLNDGLTTMEVDKFMQIIVNSYVGQTIRINKQRRCITVEALNEKVWIRKNSYQLNEFVKGMIFEEINFLDCLPETKTLVNCYSRAEKITIKKNEIRQ